MTSYAHRLVLWYKAHRREMPWRNTSNPYEIWVSETMLQQTRVETVIPYYHAFLRDFPTVAALAAADEQAVLKRWQGLGYYSRARNLHRAAKVLMADHGGEIPPDVESFRKLPGVGPYTAGAVMSIAFHLPVPAVDGNVMRVMTRWLGIALPIETAACRNQVTEQTRAWLQEADPAALTQALMELGATVCTPRSPRCEACPIAEGCFANLRNAVERFPVRKAKAERRRIDIAALWLEERGRLWLEQRPDEGLLAGMWQLPAWEVHQEGGTESELAALVRDGLEKWAAAGDIPPTQLPASFAKIDEARHIFTHLEWVVHVFRPIYTAPPAPCRKWLAGAR
ncbi:adenine DNA glycosylase [Alicyclobacillus contaminans]|nr:adenine DNA glycosylase [Alicyclobacillus contaminans]